MVLICDTASAMAALVGVPVMALVNMSMTIQRLITSPCWRLAGAGHDVRFPVSSTFWNGLTRGSLSPSGALSEAGRYGANNMATKAVHGRDCFRSPVQPGESLAGFGAL